MERPEVHKAPVLTPPQHRRTSGEHSESPIFVPTSRHHPEKLVRRGQRSRRRMQVAGVLLAVLLLGAFTYAFVVENQREKTLRSQTP